MICLGSARFGSGPLRGQDRKRLFRSLHEFDIRDREHVDHWNDSVSRGDLGSQLSGEFLGLLRVTDKDHLHRDRVMSQDNGRADRRARSFPNRAPTFVREVRTSRARTCQSGLRWAARADHGARLSCPEGVARLERRGRVVGLQIDFL